MGLMAVRRLGPGDDHVLDALLGRFKGTAAGGADAFLDHGGLAWVAEEAASVVGWCYAHELRRPDGGLQMMIYELEVAAEHRCGGLGRALVDAALTEARRRGHVAAFVLTERDNATARSLYSSVGGEQSSQRMFVWRLQ